MMNYRKNWVLSLDFQFVLVVLHAPPAVREELL